MKTFCMFCFGAPFGAAIGYSLVNSPNPLVLGIGAGFSTYMAMIAYAAFVPPKSAPRRADPAKVARMERELGIVEQPTTRVRPPADRTVEDCPRPEGCVMSHPCRKCGADKGEPCVGDVYLAPTTYLPPNEYARRVAEWTERSGRVNIVDTAHRPPAPIPGVENIARPTP